jgi:predicted SprT family Zn-dependent metalloprotease
MRFDSASSPSTSRVVDFGRAHLASLATAWKSARVSRLHIAINPFLKSTLARWRPPGNVLEISSRATFRRPELLREVITHEAAHVVVWNRFAGSVRPHGPEWADLMRAAGVQPRATLVRCGHRRPTVQSIRVRHYCPVCHFSRFARRRMLRWRCPECRAIGLEGVLKTERVLSR